jgi:hypothetical protein
MSNSKANLIRGLHGVFNANSVESITVMDKGVGVINSQGQMIHWVKETDEDKAKLVADALTDAVMDGTPVNWEALGY